MLKQVKLDESLGKTIKTVANDSDTQIIVFTDGTFVYQTIRQEFHSYSIEEPKFEIFDFYSAKCIEVGVFTQEEYDAAYKAREEQRQADLDARAREQYERLKKQFGG